MSTYKIGNINITLDGFCDTYTAKAMEAYLCSSADVIHAHISINLTDNPFQIPQDNIIVTWTHEVWRKTDTGREYYIFFPEVEGAVVKVDFDSEFKEIAVNVYDIKKHLGIDSRTFVFNTLTHVFHFVALKNDALVYHSSSISYMGEGIAFSADSGVGKSTHTSLWIKHIPGSEYINDDTPLICRIDDKLCICGSPFAGSSGINQNICVPLKAICFINRAKTNSLEKLTSSEALKLMMDQVKPPFDDEIMTYILSSIGNILKEVPVYRLNCNMEPEAAFTSQKIFNNI